MAAGIIGEDVQRVGGAVRSPIFGDDAELAVVLVHGVGIEGVPIDMSTGIKGDGARGKVEFENVGGVIDFEAVLVREHIEILGGSVDGGRTAHRGGNRGRSGGGVSEVEVDHGGEAGNRIAEVICEGIDERAGGAGGVV